MIRLSILACLLLVSCATPLHNLHRVDANVWRSSQPDAPGFEELKAAGIREVLSLRHYHADDHLAEVWCCTACRWMRKRFATPTSSLHSRC